MEEFSFPLESYVHVLWWAKHEPFPIREHLDLKKILVKKAEELTFAYVHETKEGRHVLRPDKWIMVDNKKGLRCKLVLEADFLVQLFPKDVSGLILEYFFRFKVEMDELKEMMRTFFANRFSFEVMDETSGVLKEFVPDDVEMAFTQMFCEVHDQDCFALDASPRMNGDALDHMKNVVISPKEGTLPFVKGILLCRDTNHLQ